MKLRSNSPSGRLVPYLLALAGLAGFASPQAARADEGAKPPLYLEKADAFAGKSPEAKVRELTDREELRELTATYAHRVAHGASIADLFTDDGAYIHRRAGHATREVRGRAALDAYFHDRSGDREHALPMIHNYLIEIQGDDARGINSNELRISENGQSMIASGYYEDRYRRVKGRWRFVERIITFVHWVPIQQGWALPVEEQ